MNKLLTGVIILFYFNNAAAQELPAFDPTKVPTSSYRPATQYKESWRRLSLQLSSTYFTVVKENQVNLDSSLIYASRSLGLSRLPVIAEGIDDPELMNLSEWIDKNNPAEGLRQLLSLKGIGRLQQLLMLGSYYAFQPDCYHRYRDSVNYFLLEAIRESKVLKNNLLGRHALILIGKMYVQGGDFLKGDSIFNQLFNECDLAHDEKTKAKGYYYRGLYKAYSPATTQGRIEDLEHSIRIYRRLKNSEGEINSLTDIGYLLITFFKLDDAYGKFSTALHIADSIGYPATQYNSDAMAMVQTYQGKFGEPMRFTLQTIQTAHTTQDSLGWAYFYARLAFFYRHGVERDDEALKWTRKSLDRFLKNNDPSLYLNLRNLTALLCTHGRASEGLATALDIGKKVPPKLPGDLTYYHIALSMCYQFLNQPELSKENLQHAELLIKQIPSFRSQGYQADLMYQLAVQHYMAGEFAQSRKLFERVIAQPPNGFASLHHQITTYSWLFRNDSALNDPISGVNHYRKYLRLNDAYFSASRIRQAEELQVNYLTNEKQNQIALLNQNATLEQARLDQAILIKNVTIGGIIMALIIALLLYRQTTLKQKSNNIISQKNTLLQHLVTEKEWLVKEIHHRVKNNFQTVMGLLGTQSGYLKNDIAIKAITDSQHRIQAMSLIHQKLYQSENLSAINIGDYINELVDSLRDSFNTTNRIRFDLKIEPIHLDLTYCIPIGLIINEAITNSFKYAFPENKEGIISIQLTSGLPEHLSLIIQDTGIGSDDKSPDSMGMNLMRGLSNEIGAEFKISTQNGTRIEVTFIYSPSSKPRDFNITTVV